MHGPIPVKFSKTTRAPTSYDKEIQLGKEGADTLNNFLPLFQKKLKEPAKAQANMRNTQGTFDYSKKTEAHRSRA